jgi:hypothetical protein
MKLNALFLAIALAQASAALTTPKFGDAPPRMEMREWELEQS